MQVIQLNELNLKQLFLRSSLGGYKEIKNWKQFEKLDIDQDSPCFKKAMESLGIHSTDIQKKNKEDFEQAGGEQQVIELRFTHYQNRVINTMNKIFQERKRIKETKGNQVYLERLAHLTLQSPIKGQANSTMRTSMVLADQGRSISNKAKRRQAINGKMSTQLSASVPNYPYSQRDSGVIPPKQDFFNQLNNETNKADRFKTKQEEITIKKLEKEAIIRKRNEELQKKWLKLEKFEKEYKKDLYAKSIEMSHKREEKIKQMKLAEKQKEIELNREQEKAKQLLHEKAKNFTILELERQREIRKKEEDLIKKRDEALKRREMQKQLEMEQLEAKIQQVEMKCMLLYNCKNDFIVKKGEELYQKAIEDKKTRAKEKNEMLFQQIQTFKEVQEKRDEEKFGQLGTNLLKLEQRFKSLQVRNEKEKRDNNRKFEEHKSRILEAKQNEKYDQKEKFDQFQSRLMQVQQNLENAKKEKDHELKLKQELRKLKEEDLKRTLEQKKRQAINKKMHILQKEKEHQEQLQQSKFQREIIQQAKIEQQKNLVHERKQMEEAIQMLTTLPSKNAKERYLRDNFENSFIEKLKEKVPMILEDEKKKKKGFFTLSPEKGESQ